MQIRKQTKARRSKCAESGGKVRRKSKGIVWEKTRIKVSSRCCKICLVCLYECVYKKRCAYVTYNGKRGILIFKLGRYDNDTRAFWVSEQQRQLTKVLCIKINLNGMYLLLLLSSFVFYFIFYFSLNSSKRNNEVYIRRALHTGICSCKELLGNQLSISGVAESENWLAKTLMRRWKGNFVGKFIFKLCTALKRNSNRSLFDRDGVCN